MKRRVVSGMILCVALCTTGASPLAQPRANLTVKVLDAGDEHPLPGVAVRVTQASNEIAKGITGANGTYSTAAVGAGQATVSCELLGYLRRPEVRTSQIATGENTIEVVLIPRTGSADYFRRVGRNVERRARQLDGNARADFYRSEWERIQQIDGFERQLDVIKELDGAKPYLASDPTYKQMFEKVRVVGVAPRP